MANGPSSQNQPIQMIELRIKMWLSSIFKLDQFQELEVGKICFLSLTTFVNIKEHQYPISGMHELRLYYDTMDTSTFMNNPVLMGRNKIYQLQLKITLAYKNYFITTSILAIISGQIGFEEE